MTTETIATKQETKAIENRQEKSLNGVASSFRVFGSPKGLVSWNIKILWAIAFILFWVFNPIKALPTPSEMYTSFFSMLHATGGSSLLYNVFITLKLNITALLVASIISAIISYMYVLPVLRPFNSFVRVLRYIPILAFTLVFYTLFSIGWSMKLAMVTAGMVFFMTEAMSQVIKETPPIMLDLSKSLGMNDLQVFMTVVVKPNIPTVIEVVKQNAAIGWLMIVGVESFNRTEGGIGAQLAILSSSNQLAPVYVYIAIIGVIAFLEDWLLTKSKAIIAPSSVIRERG